MFHDILTQEISLFRKKLESPNKGASKYFLTKVPSSIESENAGPHVLS